MEDLSGLLSGIFGICIGLAIIIWIIKSGVKIGVTEARQHQPALVRHPPTAPSTPCPPALATPDTAPGRYRISGVDKATKMDTVWRVRADSPANARIKAELEGIIVASVEREGA